METTDQLDASNRRLPESRVRRFAKKTETGLSSNLDFPRKSFPVFRFCDRATWLPLALKALFGASLRDNRGESPFAPKAHWSTGRRPCRTTCSSRDKRDVAGPGRHELDRHKANARLMLKDRNTPVGAVPAPSGPAVSQWHRSLSGGEPCLVHYAPPAGCEPRSEFISVTTR